MRIRAILALSFGAIVLLIASRTLWSQSRLASAIERYDEDTRRHEASEAAVRRVQAIAIDMETGVRGFELTRQESFLDPYRAAEKELEPALTALVAHEGWTPEARAHATSAADLLRTWHEEFARPITERRFDGDRSAAHAAGRRRVDGVRAELAALDADIAKSRRLEGDTFRALEADMRTESYLVGAFFVLFVAGAGVATTRSIDRALQALVRYAAKAGHGAHETIAPSALVEIQAVGLSLEALSERAASRAMRDAALATLNQELADVRTLEELADCALRHTLRATGGIGACALVRDDEGKLIPRAAIGVSLDELPADASSLALRVAARGEPEMVELQPGAIVVRTALADVTPRKLLALPVRGDRGVVAVLELMDPTRDAEEELAPALVRVASSLEAMTAERAAETLRAEVHATNQELSAQNEELRTQEEELRSQSEALARSQTDLSQRNEELLRATRAKSDFLSRMSHELRTPLNAVIGFSELILAQPSSKMSTEEKQFVQDIHGAGDQLLRLVNDVLDLARVEAGALKVSCVPMDAALAIHAALTMVGPIAKRRSVSLDAAGIPNSLPCVGDLGRVRQVVVNLVTNALKFSPEGDVVRVAARLTDDAVRIEVIDRGPGIASSEVGRLFQPFSQLAKGRAQEGGVGLGLSIVKQLVAQMHGEVGVASEPGQGATFYFLLPRAKGAQASRSTIEPEIPEIESLPDRGVAIVVEDVASEARSIEEALSRGGWRVSTYPSAEHALVALATLRPSLIIVDLGLPGMPGQTLIAELSAREALRGVPIVALTARMLDEDERAVLIEAGAALVAEKGVMTGPGLVSSLIALTAQRSLASLTRVLVVDDVEVNRRVLREMLPKDRFDVTMVESGRLALEAIAREAFEVVLMDVQMPDMDGLEATRRIHELPGMATLPVIAVTAQAMAGDRERAVTAGCVGYVAKPVGRAELLRAVEGALGRRTT